MKNQDQIDTLIVIPSYNYGKYVSEAIESALGQTVKCKVAVVDDGSTDNTKEIVAKYPEVIYFYKENGKYAAAARNYGINRVDSKYILPLDSDDILLPEYAEKASKFLDENPGYDIVTSDGLKFGDEEGIIFSSELGEWIIPNNTMVYCSMFRRSFYNQIGGYPEDLPFPGIEDWIMWIKAYRNGSKVHRFIDPLWKYRVHQGSMTQVHIMPNLAKMWTWMKEKGYQ